MQLKRIARLPRLPGRIHIGLRMTALSICLALLPAGLTDTRDQGHQSMFKNLLSKIGLSGSAAAAQQQPPESIGQLRDAVIARLRREPDVREVIADTANPAQLHTRLVDAKGETVDGGTADVSNVYGRLYILKNDLDRTAAIENLVQAILLTVRRPEIDMASVFANVRYRAPEGGDAQTAALSEPLAGDIGIVYQLDTPESLMGLSQADLGTRSMEELRAAARENIAREMAGLQEERIDGGMVAYRLPDNPPLTPAIVLTDEFWARVEKNFPHGALLILRQRDEVAVIDKSAAGAMGTAQRLIGMARERGTDFLSDLVFERRDGRLVVAE